MSSQPEQQVTLTAISLVTVLTVVSKGLGLFREMLLGWTFGISEPVAALGVANGFSSTIFEVLTLTVVVVALPLYTELKLRQGSSAAQAFLANLLSLLLLGAVPLVALLWFLATPLLRLFAGGLAPAELLLTQSFLRTVLPAAFFQIIGAICTIYLQSERKMVQIVLASMAVNIAYISAIFLAMRYGSIWLAKGVVLGAALTSLLFWLQARAHGFAWRPKLDFKDPMLRRIIYLMIPSWLGMSIRTLNIMVDRSVASYLGVGAIAAIEYAQKTLHAASSLVVPTIYLIITPLFAESAVKGLAKLREAFHKSLRYILIIMVPMTLGGIFVAHNTISVIYGYGAFDQTAIALTVQAMLFYTPNTLFLVVINEVIYRYFLALQNTLTPMLINVAALLLNIILNIILSRYMGVAGLALASTLATLLAVLLGMWRMGRYRDLEPGASPRAALPWVFLAALTMLIPVAALNLWLVPGAVLRWQRLAVILLQVALGGGAYLATISLSPLEEVVELKQMLRRR
ncbi:MAG: polysaccharide biosynthesis C-terminal domain-containing protein [Symbiobacteriaceae bacterium]|nr:polysaccharide biosynthesis C-terminal domain-containing protein [Symbiobacteriaceae bacterium]